MGNLTRDPEIRELPTGSTVCEFGLAVNDGFKNKSTGQWEKRVNFVDCVAWGDTAQRISQQFHKGRPIFIEGKLQYDSWTDKQTQKKRSKLRVLVWEWRHADSKMRDVSDVSHEQRAGHEALEEDDIPF